jgi:hypothetical protein
MVGKNILILIILFVFIIFLMLFIINKNSAKSLSTKDSLLKKDSLVESFFKKTFNGKLVHFSDKSAIIDNKHIVNVITNYHYSNPTKISNEFISKYPGSFLIKLDQEPMYMDDVYSDLTITTKSETVGLFVPTFCHTFVQYFGDEITPHDLVKTNFDTKSINIDNKIKFCLFMYSNCDESFKGVADRHNFFHKLQKATNDAVDSLGSCFNNEKNKQETEKHLNVGYDFNRNIKIIKPYKFVIAFENERIPGYITEKLINPMLSGSIPIYYGAPDVKKYFNTESFINVDDFSSFEECIEHILKIDSDDDIYRKMLSKPWINDNKLENSLFSYILGGDFYQKMYREVPLFVRDAMKLNNFTRNINFVTFSDGQKYKFDRIRKEAKNSGYFSNIKCYSPIDLGDIFWNKHSHFVENSKKGYGYWIWKPYIINLEFEKINNGDYLIYCDSGNTIKINNEIMKKYIDYMNKSDIIPFKMTNKGYIDSKYTKGDVVDLFFPDMKNIKIYEGQMTASKFMIKKSKKSVEFMKEWLKYSSIYHNIDDSPSIISNLSEFIEHRHDQSIFSMLIKKYNLEKNAIDYMDDAEIQTGNQIFLTSRVK